VRTEVKKPPTSPTGDSAEWQRQCQQYVNATWAPYSNGADSVNEIAHDKPEKTDGDGQREETCEEITDEAEIEGRLRPLLTEGERLMVCIRYELKETRFGQKVYLYWREVNGLTVLEQFFPHYDKYPVNSKAAENYRIAMGRQPNRFDRMSWRKLVGLKAEVYVETVKPTYAKGALKGREKPEAMHYSKVAEIFKPLGYVDANTLRELEGKDS
jgi:hypothetical protein